MSSANLSFFLKDLKSQFSPEKILTDPEKCFAYNNDNGRQQGKADVVVFVDSVEEIRSLVLLCNQHQVPLTPRGGGTGTPGGAVPFSGGVVLSVERMNKILRVDPINRVMVVEPGVTDQAVQDAAAELGFFWAPDPGSAENCTVAGNLAYNAGGPRTVKYGATRENTLGLRAVTGMGDLITTGVATTKSAVAYDLTRLLIGSEGTLAIITEATLKLLPLPEAKHVLQVIYTDVYSAAQAIVRVMSQSVTPSALEFIDSKSVELLRKKGVTISEKAGALLIIEVDGPENTIANLAERVIHAVKGEGFIDIAHAKTQQEITQLWKARKTLSPALRDLAPNKINEDVVVPIGQLANFLDFLQQLSKRYQIMIVNFGHGGNGNIHVNFLIDAENKKEHQHAEQALIEMFDEVIRLGGTLSGEHGIGIEKKKFLSKAVDSNTMDLMLQIKKVFDPNGILNPGKIFPM